MLKTDRALLMNALRESNAIEGVRDKDSLLRALAAWNYVSAHRRLTPEIICKTHAILMRNQRLEPWWKGRFRQCPVYIGGQQGTRWDLIPSIMRDWCYATVRYPASWATLHVIYEHIHPFVDGNGRTGRILMNWMRVYRCGLPPLVIYVRDKEEYYELFKD